MIVGAVPSVLIRSHSEGVTMIKAATAKQTLSLSAQQRAVTALSAALLGAFIVFGVGFAHSDTIHNAAHDGRHAFAFPCH